MKCMVLPCLECYPLFVYICVKYHRSILLGLIIACFRSLLNSFVVCFAENKIERARDIVNTISMIILYTRYLKFRLKNQSEVVTQMSYDESQRHLCLALTG